MRIKPKKRLGQNFLCDKNIQNKIIDILGLEGADIVLEIGAGRGEMTTLLLNVAAKIYALEIDRSLCNYLKEKFKDEPKLKIINQDVLKFNLDEIECRGHGTGIKVFGNIPYYISSPIIERLFKFKDQISEIFLTVQKEFAQRMIALPGSKEFGSFSCFVQYYAQPQIILSIKRTSFYPSPKVDSCLVKLKLRRTPAVKLKDEELFFKIIRGAFNQRRKTLKNSLLGIIPQEKLGLFFAKYAIDKRIRPERLTLEDFANLANL